LLNPLSPRSIEVQISEIPYYFDFLEDYLGAEEITHRLEQVNRAIHTESGAYLNYWLIPNSSFWLGIQEARHLRDKNAYQGKKNYFLERPTEIAAKLKILCKYMPTRVWNELKTRILRADYLSPIFFEIDTAAHFWEMGYEIEWFEPADKPNTRIPEFTLITSDNRRIEVECKAKRADAGRKILRPLFYHFVDELAAPLSKIGYTGKIQIVVPDRMPTESSWKKLVTNAVDQLLSSMDVQLRLEDGTDITIDLHKLDGLIIPANKVVLEAQAAKQPYSYLAIFAKEYGKVLVNPLIIELKSQFDDNFITDVFDSLSNANQQFSGNNAAIICCFMPEIDSFAGLQQDSALFNMTRTFFQKSPKPYLFAVTYTSDSIRTTTALDISKSSPAIRVDNPFYDENFGPRIRVI
jgi:hypothetical protein